MNTIEAILNNKRFELWLKWITRFITIILIPACIFATTWFKAEIVAHGNEHFVPKTEFKYIPNNITDISNRLVHVEANKWKRDEQEKFVRQSELDIAILKKQVSDIAEVLKELKGDIKELRTDIKGIRTPSSQSNSK